MILSQIDQNFCAHDPFSIAIVDLLDHYFPNLAQSLTSTRTSKRDAIGLHSVVNFCYACAILLWSAVDPVITFLVALLRANYETTGVSSKKTGGTSIKRPMHIIIAMEFCVRIINGNGNEDTLLPT